MDVRRRRDACWEDGGETRGDAAGGRNGSALGRGHLRPLSSQVVDRASISTITHDQQRSGVVLTGSSRSSQKLAPSLQHSSDAPSRTSTPAATSQLRALRMPHGSPNATERARRRSEVVEGDPKGICLARGEGQPGLRSKNPPSGGSPWGYEFRLPGDRVVRI